MYILRPRELFHNIPLHKEQLMGTYPSLHIVHFEEEFRDFKVQVTRKRPMQYHIEIFKMSIAKGDTVLRKSWHSFKGQFEKHIKFYGALITVFTGTTTFVSGSPIRKWEDDEYRS